MRSVGLVLFLTFVMAGLGCSNRSDRGPNAQAASLIDQGRNSDAVDTLTFQMNQEPTNTKTRLLLASALAARNGLYLTGFSDFARLIIAQSREAKADGETKINVQVGLIFSALNSAPTLTTGLADIVRAIEVLEVSELSTGGFLYRSLLKLVVFKHRFNGEYRLKPTSECQITPKSLDAWLENVERDLQDILKDASLSLVKPDKKADLQAAQTKIKDLNQDIRESLVPELGKPLIKMPFILKLNYLECL